MAEGYTGVTINPRPYQKKALRETWKLWMKGLKRLLLVLPTGSGKTMVFSMLINHVVKNEGAKVLVLAHRSELLEQAQDKLISSTGIDSALDKASETGHDSFHSVVVGSVQTLSNTKRMRRYAKDHFDYIIVDETHRVMAETYQRILNYFDTAKVLGVTATPMRGDKQSLGNFFDNISYEYSLEEAINDGWLTPISAETVPIRIDISDCKVNAGDYALGDIDCAIAPHLEAIADQIIEKASDRKVIIFLPLVATSKAMADILTAKGFESRSVDGSMNKEERAATLEWYKNAPRGTALCNSMLATEGFDQADIDCVICLRATKSEGLYRQMIGRGTRVLDPSINNEGLTAKQRRDIIAKSDKKDLYIMDFLWLTAQHRLCSPAKLFARSETAEEALMERMNKGGKLSAEEMEDIVSSSEVEKREAALAEKLEALKGRGSKKIDPVTQSLSMFDDSILTWEPQNKRQLDPITNEQYQQLEYYGIKNADSLSSGFAKKLLDVIQDRRDKGLCTPKQLNLLRKFGVKNAHKVTFDTAKELIDKRMRRYKR